LNKLIQYDLFLPIPNEMETVSLKIEAIQESQHKQRKSLFAKHGELAKMFVDLYMEHCELKKKYHDLDRRFEILETNICKGNVE
jgi:hypothetical protein